MATGSRESGRFEFTVDDETLLEHGEPMFEDQTACWHFDIESECELTEPLNLGTIIERCSGLPPKVKATHFTHVEERVIEKNLLDRLTNKLSLERTETDSIARLQSRREALTPYLGSTLVCVFIRLPGVHYTIEIDPINKTVVYWEWQQT